MPINRDIVIQKRKKTMIIETGRQTGRERQTDKENDTKTEKR